MAPQLIAYASKGQGCFNVSKSVCSQTAIIMNMITNSHTAPMLYTAQLTIMVRITTRALSLDIDNQIGHVEL